MHRRRIARSFTPALLLTLICFTHCIPVSNAGNYTFPWVDALVDFDQPEEERAAHRSLCLEELKQEFVRVIQSLVPLGSPAVLLGVSKHIQGPLQALSLYGEVAGVLAAGVDLSRVCFTFDKECTRSAVAELPLDGSVLIHGGEDLHGSAGALLHGQWAEFLEVSQKHRLVLLPQAHWFRERDSTSRSQVGKWEHPRAYLLVTSQPTLGYSRKHFGAFFKDIRIVPHPGVNYGHVKLPKWIYKAMLVLFVGHHRPDLNFEDECAPKFVSIFGESYKADDLGVFNWTQMREVHHTRGRKGRLARSFLLEHSFDFTTTLAKELKKGKVVIGRDLPVVLLCILADIHVISLEAPEVVGEISTMHGASRHCFAGFRYLTAPSLVEARAMIKRLYELNVVPL